MSSPALAGATHPQPSSTPPCPPAPCVALPLCLACPCPPSHLPHSSAPHTCPSPRLSRRPPPHTHTCAGASVIPREGLSTRPCCMICSTRPRSVSMGTAKPQADPQLESTTVELRPTMRPCTCINPSTAGTRNKPAVTMYQRGEAPRWGMQWKAVLCCAGGALDRLCFAALCCTGAGGACSRDVVCHVMSFSAAVHQKARDSRASASRMRAWPQ